MTVGTLLGPEGAGDLLSLAQDHPWSQTSRHRSGHGGAWWGGGCLLVENCTVDASIFCRPHRSFGEGVGWFLSSVCFCVLVKLLRAYGGCLGIRSR